MNHNEQIRLILADDHAIVRDGLRRLLEDKPNLKIVGEASNADETIKLARQLRPDILILDLLMPRHPGQELRHTGLEVLRELNSLVRTILLTAEIEKTQLVEALQLGARGVMLKESATQVLLKAIQAVTAGKYWFYLEPAENVIQYLQTLKVSTRAEVKQKSFGLTGRELEIVSTVVAGYSNKEIAEHLKITEDTVKHHLSNIFDKLGVSSRLELALFAVNHDIPLPAIE